MPLVSRGRPAGAEIAERPAPRAIRGRRCAAARWRPSARRHAGACGYAGIVPSPPSAGRGILVSKGRVFWCLGHRPKGRHCDRRRARRATPVLSFRQAVRCAGLDITVHQSDMPIRHAASRRTAVAPGFSGTAVGALRSRADAAPRHAKQKVRRDRLTSASQGTRRSSCQALGSASRAYVGRVCATAPRCSFVSVGVHTDERITAWQTQPSCFT
jgi:hypothetical protein